MYVADQRKQAEGPRLAWRRNGIALITHINDGMTNKRSVVNITRGCYICDGYISRPQASVQTIAQLVGLIITGLCYHHYCLCGAGFVRRLLGAIRM